MARVSEKIRRKNKPELTIEDVMADLSTAAIFKDFLRTIRSADYINGWAQLNRVMQIDDLISRIPHYSQFRWAYIREGAEHELHLDTDLRTQTMETKIPSNELLETLRNAIVNALMDGYIQMITNPEWRKRLKSGSPPRWAKRHTLGKVSRRDSDELLIQAFRENIESKV